MPKETRFVSVEVVIRTSADCQDWITWFERRDNHVTNVPSEKNASFVYFAPLPSGDANLTIRELCKEINELPENVRLQWANAEEREFFIGYHVGETPNCFVEHVDVDTLEMVHQNNASIRIALYPAPTESVASFLGHLKS